MEFTQEQLAGFKQGIPDAESRRYAASLLRRHFDGSVTPEVLVQNFGDSTDPLIQAAMNIAAHQPRRGFLGVSERHWKSVYWPRVQHLLAELEKGENGVAPESPLYPVASPLRILGLFVFAIVILGAAGGHIVKVWKHVSGAQRLGDWSLLVEMGLSVVLSLGALGAVAAFVNRVRLRLRRSSRGHIDAG